MKTILIVDDDCLCRKATAEVLRRCDWEVLEAESGESGLQMALTHRPEVILSDLLMPQGNGFTLCRAVRARPELVGTRLLVMSGRNYPTDRTNAAEAGADAYLVKPVPFDVLMKALSESPANGTPKADGPRPAVPAPNMDLGSSNDGTTQLRFWGVRGSIPTPGPTTVHYGGNTSCVEVRAEGELIVLDAGTGIRELGVALAREFREVGMRITLLISHTHWDHIQGFPFFRPAYDPRNIVRILGYEGAAAGLKGTLAGQMESPYFPIPLTCMPGNLQIEELRDMEFHIGPIRVTTCFSKHPGVCVGFRLHTAAGDIVYLPDNEWAQAEGSAAQDEQRCSQENALLAFLREADVVIIDAQYDRDEYDSHQGWGHGCVDDVVRLAMLAKVKHLFLFHHDPEHSDEHVTRMVAEARELAKEATSPIEIDAAREGLQVVLRRK